MTGSDDRYNMNGSSETEISEQQEGSKQSTAKRLLLMALFLVLLCTTKPNVSPYLSLFRKQVILLTSLLL